MNVVPGMWFKLVHGASHSLNERYLVKDVSYAICMGDYCFPTIKKFVYYHSHYLKGGLWIADLSFSVSLEDFNKAFEPDTL